MKQYKAVWFAGSPGPDIDEINELAQEGYVVAASGENYVLMERDDPDSIKPVVYEHRLIAGWEDELCNTMNAMSQMGFETINVFGRSNSDRYVAYLRRELR